MKEGGKRVGWISEEEEGEGDGEEGKDENVKEQEQRDHKNANETEKEKKTEKVKGIENQNDKQPEGWWEVVQGVCRVLWVWGEVCKEEHWRIRNERYKLLSHISTLAEREKKEEGEDEGGKVKEEGEVYWWMVKRRWEGEMGEQEKEIFSMDMIEYYSSSLPPLPLPPNQPSSPFSSSPPCSPTVPNFLYSPDILPHITNHLFKWCQDLFSEIDPGEMASHPLFSAKTNKSPVNIELISNFLNDLVTWVGVQVVGVWDVEERAKVVEGMVGLMGECIKIRNYLGGLGIYVGLVSPCVSGFVLPLISPFFLLLASLCSHFSLNSLD